MSERKPRKDSQRHWSIGFVLMLLTSTLLAMVSLPAASAASGSLGITASASPTKDTWYSSWDTLSFSAEITNYYLTPSGSARTLTWYACAGDVSLTTCKSVYVDSGTFSMRDIPANSSDTISSPNQWTPGQVSGMYTIVYAFSSLDSTGADDQFLFHINLTFDFVDVIVDQTHNPLSHLPNLATYNNELVLNSNTDYVFKSKGQSTVCGDCIFSAEFGWQLWDTDETVLIQESYKSVSTLPAWGGIDPFNINLPVFNFASEGRFLLKYGMFTSSGNPHGDLNDYNNLARFEIVLNNSLDLKVKDVYPSHSQTASLFYFGTNRVISEISNVGNRTVTDVNVQFNVFDQQFNSGGEGSCLLPAIHPGQTLICQFNLTTTGNSRLLRVQVPTIYDIGTDARVSDNTYSLTTNIQVGPIYPNIQINSQNRVFLTSDEVELVGRYSELASQPLNFTWREGFYQWGYGNILNRTAGEFGLGHHNITLQVQDPWGNMEYTSVQFDVLNALDLTNEPYFTGVATLDRPATFSSHIQLPSLGTHYSIGQGKSALMLVDLDIQEAGGTTDGLRTLVVDLNLSAILPSNVDLGTVELRYLPNLESQVWTVIDGDEGYEFNNEGNRVSVHLNTDGVLLIIGRLPPADVSPEEVGWKQLKGGQIALNWTGTGDITNPYVGGWKIYKLQGTAGTTVFPDPSVGINDEIWEELTTDSLVATLELDEQVWVDPEPLETDICASYAIAPIDRSGTPNFQMVNITRVDGTSALACGDSIAPVSVVSQFRSTWKFTNDTGCFDARNDWSACYNVTLTWIWPNQEVQGNLSWNLYRVEFAPNNIDLKYINPISSGLTGVPQQTATFTQSGLEVNGIRPYRTYYYILAPVDSVGNEQMFANYPSPNIVRVHIDDDWWAYNQHIIPPEPEPPEPPLGIPWLQKLNDSMQISAFQIAGIVLLATIVLNFILLPLMLKKRKRLKRVIEARKRNSTTSNEFDDFFE